MNKALDKLEIICFWVNPVNGLNIEYPQSEAIHIGEITGEYQFDLKQGDPYYHSRTGNWFATDVPRSNFDQDLLYSFGAFMTVGSESCH